MISAQEAIERLRDGNRRFAAGTQLEGHQPKEYRQALASAKQEPFAIILGCSDSRVPAEIVFDQGLGDLFVIRVAGNIVAPSQIGSVEFAATRFGTRLVVVLGHSQCGAVLATLDALRQEAPEQRSINERSIVDRIMPAVMSLNSSDHEDDPEALCEAAVRANVHASVDQLKSGSRVLAQLIDEQELRIVGAEYSLESAAVEFL
jgi:carbonic anhydrase